MYAKLFRNHLFPFYETFLRKRKTLIYLKELEKNQWFSEKKLKEIQWNKFKKLLKHSYENVPYYNNKFKELNLHPDDIKTHEDIKKIPVLTRDDIRNHEKELIANNFKNKKLQLA